MGRAKKKKVEEFENYFISKRVVPKVILNIF